MMRLGIVLSVLFTALMLGCSQAGDVIQLDEIRHAGGAAPHKLLALCQFQVFPDEGRMDIIPLREAALHLNAVPFLEPAPPHTLYVGLDGGIKIDAHSVRCKIKLEHPLGGTQFPGFDVCGILIGRGSLAPYTDPDIVIAGENDVHLVNADGRTRWWNPAEFPHIQGAINAYNDGFLGTPYSVGNFTATVNGYKYYADGLGPEDDVATLNTQGRSVFSPATAISRYYHIEFGDGPFIFNYAVDACWMQPVGVGPWEIPDDFLPGANRPEAWNIDFGASNNDLWNDGSSCGGSFDARVVVYDHYVPENNTVRIESPGNVTMAQLDAPVETGDGYSVYELSFADCTPAENSIDLFISVENTAAGYNGHLPGKHLTTYFIRSIEVSPYPPGVDADLILDALRNDYAPPGPGYPQSWITGIFLDWGDLPGAVQYAVYRSPLWADTYEWELIGTTDAPTTEFTNTIDDDHPIDWDADYIYEVRPRTIPGDPASEGPPTQMAFAILESNDEDAGKDPNNPRWESRYGAGGSSNCFYGGMDSSDEGFKAQSVIKMSTLQADSWEVVFLPYPVPDIYGFSECFIDFAFSTFYGIAIPFVAGFAPGTMDSLPENEQEHCLEFRTAPFTSFVEGQPYTNGSCPAFELHFGGGSAWAYSGKAEVFRATRFKLPRLLKPEVDYAGIGFASTNAVLTYTLDLGFDSIAVFGY